MTVLVANLLYKRRLAQLLLDAVLIVLAYYGAFRLKFDPGMLVEYGHVFQLTLGVVIVVKVVAFGAFGVYRGAWKYSSLVDMLRILGAVAVGALASLAYLQWRAPAVQGIPSVIVIDALLLAAFALSSRVSFRVLETVRSRLQPRGDRVLIYGAGDGGEIALREVVNNPRRCMWPACFLDDEATKHGMHIHGVPVVGGLESLGRAVQHYRVSKIVIGTQRPTPEAVATLSAFAKRHALELVELHLDFRPVTDPDVSTAQHVQPHPAPAEKRISTLG
jgi:UDP-GlcNAc:undecaprenyl-phosphate GlcNAc-1-phosphate transferase